MKLQTMFSGSKSFGQETGAHTDGRKKWTLTGVLALALLLAGCGGGGDSSSGGGGGSSAGIAGTYSGLASGTISASGVPSQNVSGTVTFVIDTAGNVTYDPGQSYSVTVPLNGDSFALSVPLSVLDSRCRGTMNLQGTASGGVITGSISSSGASCLGVSVTVSGSFSASKIAKALSRSRHPFMDSLGTALGTMR